MTLVSAILNKVKSNDKIKKFTSPPPEIEEITQVKKKRKPHKYAHVRAKVDSSPPRYDPARFLRNLPDWHQRIIELYNENIGLLNSIKNTHLNRGRVDSRWEIPPVGSKLYYHRRADFYRRVQAQNRTIYRRICDSGPRVMPTASLRRDWAINRQTIIRRAQNNFVLFPPIPQEVMEDVAFQPPPGVKRPRVYLALRVRNCSLMGELCVELFTDVCPKTCELFLQLLNGDAFGYSYIGTCFYRKVPGLYWSGGDVIHNNGFGCYAQRDRCSPTSAENFHFPHSMPGLVSMRVTTDDEICGMFNITFKALPQFDLRNVVFGRVIRPSSTYESILNLGSPLSSYPVIELAAAKMRAAQLWLKAQKDIPSPADICLAPERDIEQILI